MASILDMRRETPIKTSDEVFVKISENPPGRITSWSRGL